MTDQQVDGLDAADDEVASIDVVTLLSDRGSGSEWVGTLHSILRQLAPTAAIIDLAHDVAVDDVKAASLALARSVQYLAPGVIVASVAADAEPTMRHIAVSAAGGNAIFVGPDNGVLASALAMVGGAEEAVILDRADLFLESPGTLDPGRDIYAPIAGQLCAGASLADLGTPIDPVLLRPGLLPLPSEEGSALVGEILAVGHRGVLHVNVEPEELAAWGDSVTIRIGECERTAHRVEHFSEISPGGLGLVVDAMGMVAVAANGSSAAEDLSAEMGDQVRFTPSEAEVKAGVTTAVALGRNGHADNGSGASRPSGGPVIGGDQGGKQ